MSRTDFLFKGLVRLLLFYVFFVFLMFAFRTFFIGYFGELSHLARFQTDLILAFFIGWKYDTLVLSYLLLPFYLILIPVSLLKNLFIYNVYQSLKIIAFMFYGLVLPLLLIADLGFYSYFQDHFNILIFGFLEDDTAALLETIWKNYPIEYVLVGLVGWIFILIKISRVLFPKVMTKTGVLSGGALKYLVLLIFSFVLMAGALRGGYGALVLAPKYSDFSESEFVNQAAVNGLVSLEKTIKLRVQSNRSDFSMAESMGYQNGIHQAFNDFLGWDVSDTPKEQLINLIKRKTTKNKKLELDRMNVVVIVMESFGSHWLKYNSNEFNFLGPLKKHFEQDHYFENIISSGNGTIGSLLTVATNIPPRPGKRFLSESKYLRMPLDMSANIPFQNQGYETTFVYGGKLGWRDIGKYFKYQKYDNTIGENAIRNTLLLKKKAGTEWGLYDDHFFDYILLKLKQGVKPQFMLGLSTSNHPPFEYPKTYQKLPLVISDELGGKILREKDLFIKRFEAFQYANVALANFIQKVKNSSLAANTIIAVTGDHNFWGFINYERSESYKKYLVPFYLYLPPSLSVAEYNSKRLGSHEDIMPTLYNLSLSETEYLSLGEDLFSVSKSYAINSSLYASKEGVIYKNQAYQWDQIPFVQNDKSQQSFPDLSKRYRSTMTIADYYLELVYKQFKAVSH